jgi:hypothetical protein
VGEPQKHGSQSRGYTEETTLSKRGYSARSGAGSGNGHDRTEAYASATGGNGVSGQRYSNERWIVPAFMALLVPVCALLMMVRSEGANDGTPRGVTRPAMDGAADRTVATTPVWPPAGSDEAVCTAMFEWSSHFSNQVMVAFLYASDCYLRPRSANEDYRARKHGIDPAVAERIRRAMWCNDAPEWVQALRGTNSAPDEGDEP